MRAAVQFMLALIISMPALVQAAPTPQEVVDDTSRKVMAVLDANRETYRNDPDAFVRGLDEVLNPVVDFEGIASSVMTVRYSRSATEEQTQRFIDTFKRSMVQFYGNALLEFKSGEITVLPPNSREPRPDRASVDMQVKAKDGQVYTATYTMTEIDGQWKVRNVIVEGINIGLLFRDQFAQAMKANRNDLDAVIDNWGSVVAKSRETVKKETTE
ncbi:MAG TPA: ABC transporter substrate-binding protein [Pseudomonas sabulinigri]|uniref:Toluene tolerance protein n=1 Tax=marine sediment metagenome TaxID=412755 RepID=A0A0F9WQP0_9ZZZZ|nr:ABC transporter substrate-binding protein [Halopseudomonas sabulinigri]HEC52319.1 ABC transporter substrate-binding protein [Halopseudomonas sabulinigri]